MNTLSLINIYLFNLESITYHIYVLTTHNFLQTNLCRGPLCVISFGFSQIHCIMGILKKLNFNGSIAYLLSISALNFNLRLTLVDNKVVHKHFPQSYSKFPKTVYKSPRDKSADERLSHKFNRGHAFASRTLIKVLLRDLCAL